MRTTREGRGDAFITRITRSFLMKTKKCPVCDWDIKDDGIKVKVGGQEIVVCCDDCAKKAKAEPAKYAGAAK
jgi:ribosome-binding protein aMBF1 (putative translation factor)